MTHTKKHFLYKATLHVPWYKQLFPPSLPPTRANGLAVHHRKAILYLTPLISSFQGTIREGEAQKWEPQAISVAHSLHPQSVKRKIQCQHQLLPADETGSSAFYFLARSPYKPLQKDRRQTDSSIYRPLPITNLGHTGSFVPSMKCCSLFGGEPWYSGGITEGGTKKKWGGS